MRDLILQLSKSSIYSTKPIEACRLRLREGDKLTPLADARYCLNNNPTQTLKIRNATHYSSERWTNAGK
ncbi:hypothetical protein nublan015_46550 [Klebsiella pneumoniae]|uniref:histidine kinase n=1 Tax=Klebsiella pneumoniae TaxID=573 RepID=UPI00313FC9F1